jgi:iron complex transport system substrate-binding protein
MLVCSTGEFMSSALIRTVGAALVSVLVAVAAPALSQDFPVTIKHERGEAVIQQQPKRVVSIGVHEQDFLYALGVAPVGVHEWWGEYPYATWPWADDARIAVGAEPQVLMGWEINVEWVAALKPDLIVASYFSDLDDETYGLLTAIAPVVTAPHGYPAWGAPWQDELRLLGQATGTSAKAEEIVASIEKKFADVRAAYPQFAGKTAATGYFDAGVVRTYNSADTAHRFLQGLGLTIPKIYDEQAVDRGHIDISTENLDLIELDAFVWPEGTKGLEDVSVYQNTRLAREGRSVSLGGGVLSGALSFQTPLALGYLLNTLPPMIDAAIDGDPATNVAAPQ